MSAAVNTFLGTLSPEEQKVAIVPFDDPVRFDWNYTPRSRKGITFKTMSPKQREAVFAVLKVVLSQEGYVKTQQIIDLENVLRVVESRPANDTYRDPENYAMLVYGKPGNEPWGWRFEGHHISLHFSIVNGAVSFTPGFLGSNPGKVLADMPQKGRVILKEEQELAFQLLQTLDAAQQKMAVLSERAPSDMLTTNSRKASLKRMDGLALSAMRPKQQELFKKLIRTYLERYHVTLKNQQWAELEKQGLDKIRFVWMGDRTPEIGDGHGHYYRIHGPDFLIEFDNTQNGGNHIHSVVRDLTSDFGEDMLEAHYKKAHRKHQN